MTTPRPLFFSDLVSIDTQQHRQLPLPAERRNFAFTASANVIPLTAPEVGAAICVQNCANLTTVSYRT
jgi:hypothetical protein